MKKTADKRRSDVAAVQLDVVRWEIPVLSGRRPNRLFRRPRPGRDFGQSPILMKLSDGSLGGMRLSMMSSSKWGRGGLAPSRPARRGPPIKEESLQSIAPRGGTLHDRKYAVLVSQEMIASTPRTAAAAAWDGGLGLLEPARSGGAA